MGTYLENNTYLLPYKEQFTTRVDRQGMNRVPLVARLLDPVLDLVEEAVWSQTWIFRKLSGTAAHLEFCFATNLSSLTAQFCKETPVELWYTTKKSGTCGE